MTLHSLGHKGNKRGDVYIAGAHTHAYTYTLAKMIIIIIFIIMTRRIKYFTICYSTYDNLFWYQLFRININYENYN